MTINKKLLATAAVVAFSITVQSVAFSAAQFNDVSTGYWADKYIDYLTDKSIVTGYPDSTFRPNKAVTRAEFAVMLAKSQGLNTTPANRTAFNDIPSGHWASGAVESVAQHGWIAGYPGSMFRPNQPISMAEMYTIVSKVSGNNAMSDAEVNAVLNNFTDSTTIPNWARASVATAVDMGVYVSEVSDTQLMPNYQASRAKVATTLAKLLNNDYRTGDVDVAENQPEEVNFSGTLMATARSGEWMIKTDDKQYILANPSQYTSQSWFRHGSEVSLSGTINEDASSNTRIVVNADNLNATATSQNRVAVTGTLRPSNSSANAWVLVTDSGQRYRIMNPEEYTGQSWFGYGATVSLTGNTREDINLASSEGTAIFVSNLQAATPVENTTVTGTLQQTAKAGGWFIETSNGQKYVLLDVDNMKNENWFQAGTKVEIDGNIRTDIPTIYNEGPVLKVSEVTPDPTQVAGLQNVKLYYPNPLNLLRSPALQLGEPVVRQIEGPNLPEKTIQALITGPNNQEAVRGFYFDSELKKLTLDSFALSNGTANVVLKAPAVDFNFGDSAILQQRLDAQITNTLRQFSGIQNVDIKVVSPENTVIWDDMD